MRRRSIVAFLLLASAGVATAGEMEVNPVLVALSREEKSAVVTIRNRSNGPARYQISLLAWDQTPAGEMKLSPTREVVAFPPVLQLAANEAKILRVGAKVPFGPVERTYRLFIEEMPPPPSEDQPTRVQVLSRVGVPVFVEPTQRVETAELRDLAVRDGKAAVVLHNAGNVRVRPSAVSLVLEGSAGAVLHERSLEAWYVLAASRREYLVDVPPDACAAVRRVTVSATLPKETLRASLDTPQGACAR